jgi:NADPH:quinone reductase-like Zn-dependent oxidoreductase
VWDAVGGAQFPRLVEATAVGGQIITYGGLAPDSVSGTPMPWFPLIGKGISIRGYTLFELTYSPQRFGKERPYHPTAYTAAKEFVLKGVEAGTLKLVISEVFPIDQIVKAHTYVEENQKLGKVVVRV